MCHPKTSNRIRTDTNPLGLCNSRAVANTFLTVRGYSVCSCGLRTRHRHSLGAPDTFPTTAPHRPHGGLAVDQVKSHHTPQKERPSTHSEGFPLGTRLVTRLKDLIADYSQRVLAVSLTPPKFDSLLILPLGEMESRSICFRATLPRTARESGSNCKQTSLEGEEAVSVLVRRRCCSLSHSHSLTLPLSGGPSSLTEAFLSLTASNLQ